MTFEETLKLKQTMMIDSLLENTAAKNEMEALDMLYLSEVLAKQEGDRNSYVEAYKKDYSEYMVRSENQNAYFISMALTDRDAKELMDKSNEMNEKKRELDSKIEKLMGDLQTLEKDGAKSMDEDAEKEYKKEHDSLTEDIQKLNVEATAADETIGQLKKNINAFVNGKLEEEKEKLDERKTKVDLYEKYSSSILNKADNKKFTYVEPKHNQIEVALRYVEEMNNEYKKSFSLSSRIFSFIPGAKAHDASVMLDKMMSDFCRFSGVRRSDLNYYFKNGSMRNTLFDKYHGIGETKENIKKPVSNDEFVVISMEDMKKEDNSSLNEVRMPLSVDEQKNISEEENNNLDDSFTFSEDGDEPEEKEPIDLSK